MNFEQIEPISHPIQRVYEALRDQTPELGAYLPQITSITEIEREPEVDGITRVVCKWQANDKSAPAAVRPFLSPKMLSWLDHAQWVDGEHLVHWRLQPATNETLFDCGGTNRVEALDDKTCQFRLQGTLNVYPERVPGVPRFLARRLRSKIEEWMVRMITPNLAELPKAVQQFLDEQG